MQDHARGLLSSDRVQRKLYELMTESLDFTSTLTYLESAKNDIVEQNKEVSVAALVVFAANLHSRHLCDVVQQVQCTSISVSVHHLSIAAS